MPNPDDKDKISEEDPKVTLERDEARRERDEAHRELLQCQDPTVVASLPENMTPRWLAKLRRADEVVQAIDNLLGLVGSEELLKRLTIELRQTVNEAVNAVLVAEVAYERERV